MPETLIYFYEESEGVVPVLDWLTELKKRNKKAFAKCAAAIERLADFGFELRRPHADILRDGIYELRVRHERTNYRILYFFHGQNIGILAQGLVKESLVPDIDIERAIERRRKLEQDPEHHTFQGEV